MLTNWLFPKEKDTSSISIAGGSLGPSSCLHRGWERGAIVLHDCIRDRDGSKPLRNTDWAGSWQEAYSAFKERLVPLKGKHDIKLLK